MAHSLLSADRAVLVAASVLIWCMNVVVQFRAVVLVLTLNQMINVLFTLAVNGHLDVVIVACL